MIGPRIGYVPYDVSLKRPGDKRRFIAYAQSRGLSVEIARPEERYDLVVLTELADISAWSSYPHGKIVYDLIDSYLAVPRSNIRQWLRAPVWYALGRYRRLRFDYWQVVRDMCRRADAVVCSTEEQRSDILPYCTNTHIVLDIHDSAINSTKSDYRRDGTFNIVWEGLPSNLPQLAQLRSVLRDVNRSSNIRLHIVTDPTRPRILGRFGRIESLEAAQRVFEDVQFHAWDEHTLSDIVTSCDLGVIPIDLSDRFVKGKPENKLLLMWRMCMPVVTSATPAYQRAMSEVGLQDFCCRTDAEWRVALERMMSNEQLRKDAGRRGRKFAETVYGRHSTLARWDAVMRSVGFSVD